MHRASNRFGVCHLRAASPSRPRGVSNGGPEIRIALPRICHYDRERQAQAVGDDGGKDLGGDRGGERQVRERR